jgi:hypothetical protein
MRRAVREWHQSDEQLAKITDYAMSIMETTTNALGTVYACLVVIEVDRALLKREKLALRMQAVRPHEGRVSSGHPSDLSRLSDEELDRLSPQLAAQRQSLPPAALPSPPDPACAQAKEVEGVGTPRPP